MGAAVAAGFPCNGFGDGVSSGWRAVAVFLVAGEEVAASFGVAAAADSSVVTLQFAGLKQPAPLTVTADPVVKAGTGNKTPGAALEQPWKGTMDGPMYVSAKVFDNTSK